MMHAMGRGAGIGLGLLHSLGTIRCILAIVWTVKGLVSGGRGFVGRVPWGRRPSAGHDDGALAAARELFAGAEMPASIEGHAPR
jgi:hypothetical protein